VIEVDLFLRQCYGQMHGRILRRSADVRYRIPYGVQSVFPASYWCGRISAVANQRRVPILATPAKPADDSRPARPRVAVDISFCRIATPA
jgi:hypothetical protein